MKKNLLILTLSLFLIPFCFAANSTLDSNWGTITVTNINHPTYADPGLTDTVNLLLDPQSSVSINYCMKENKTYYIHPSSTGQSILVTPFQTNCIDGPGQGGLGFWQGNCLNPIATMKRGQNLKITIDWQNDFNQSPICTYVLSDVK